MVARSLAFVCLFACGEPNTEAPREPNSAADPDQNRSESPPTGPQTEPGFENNQGDKSTHREKIHGAPVMGQSSSHQVRGPDPDHKRSTNPEIQQAMLLIEAQSYDEAKPLLEQAVTQYPEDADAQYWMGQLYQAQGQYSEAVQWMQQATEMDPEFASAWWAIGFNFAIQRNCADALGAQNRYIELRPNDPSGYYNRASCRWYTKDRDGSLADGQKACDMGHQMACTHTKKQIKRQAMIKALEAERANNSAPVHSNTSSAPNP